MKQVQLNFPLRFSFFHLLLSLLLTAPLSLSAQVHVGNLTLTNQAAVDAFSFTEVTGLLRISGSDINNLLGLSSLTSVGEGLWINNNDALLNLDGLSSLTSVGEILDIKDNASLTNLHGLSSLTSVGEGLWIYNNDALPNLDGLSALTSVGGFLYISFNDALTNLDGLSPLTSVGGDLSIYKNDALPNIDGLSSLTSVGGRMEIYYNSSLPNLDGLSALTSVGKNLDIRNNTVLTNLDGLSALTSVGLNVSWWQDASLSIDNNAALTNLDGLSSLTTVGGLISISYNSSLTDLDGLSSLTSVVMGLRVFRNPSLAGFCGLHPLLNGGGTGSLYDVFDNFYNPTIADILAGGPCNLDPAQIIADLLAGGTLNQGQANALNTKLKSCNLNAFNNLANAWVNAGILSQAQADGLTAAAAQHCAPASRIAAQQAFALGQNYPNPARTHTVIPFTLATSSKVSIQLYDAAGKMVSNLMDQFLTEGTHEVKVNLQAVPAGTYFYKVQVGEYSETLPMVVE